MVLIAGVPGMAGGGRRAADVGFRRPPGEPFGASGVIGQGLGRIPKILRENARTPYRF
jgi:hypothetical protein